MLNISFFRRYSKAIGSAVGTAILVLLQEASPEDVAVVTDFLSAVISSLQESGGAALILGAAAGAYVAPKNVDTDGDGIPDHLDPTPRGRPIGPLPPDDDGFIL